MGAEESRRISVARRMSAAAAAGGEAAEVESWIGRAGPVARRLRCERTRWNGRERAL